VRDKVNIKLSDATAIELAKRPMNTIPASRCFSGKYTIKFLARDDETGRIGTYQKYVCQSTLEQRGKEESRSAPCIGAANAIELKRFALYNAVKDRANERQLTRCPQWTEIDFPA